LQEDLRQADKCETWRLRRRSWLLPFRIWTNPWGVQLPGVTFASSWTAMLLVSGSGI